MAEFQLPRIGDCLSPRRTDPGHSELHAEEEHALRGDPFLSLNVRQPELPQHPRPQGLRPRSGHAQAPDCAAGPAPRRKRPKDRELYNTPLFGESHSSLGFLSDTPTPSGPSCAVERVDRPEYSFASAENAEVQDAMAAMIGMSLHMVYVGRGAEDPPRVLKDSEDRKTASKIPVQEVPCEAEAVVALVYADFLDIACSVITTLKRALCARPIIPVVLRPAHGVFLDKLSSVAMTLKKGGADVIIMQPRHKLDLEERLQAALGSVGVRWEVERSLTEEPDVRANSLFFEVLDQTIEGFPRLNANMEERRATRSSLGGVGRHDFTRALGEGKFGKVYTAASLDRPDAPCEAVKVISKRNIRTAKHCSHILKECRLLQKVRHPNICEFRGLVHAMWHVYIFMEFVGTLDLSTVIRRAENGRLESSHVLEFFLQICDAVAYCHSALVAHRDIKSENVVITAEAVPKLVDFGLSVQLSNSPQSDLCGDKCGTIPFAPPEVYRGKKFEARAMDVWGLGILTLEMRCGNNSVCRMLGCVNASEPNDELAEIMEQFFSCPDWPQIAQKANPGVGMAAELLVVMRNSLVVEPELRWCAADLWKQIAYSTGQDRETGSKSQLGRETGRSSTQLGSDSGSVILEHSEYHEQQRSTFTGEDFTEPGRREPRNGDRPENWTLTSPVAPRLFRRDQQGAANARHMRQFPVQQG